MTILLETTTRKYANQVVQVTTPTATSHDGDEVVGAQFSYYGTTANVGGGRERTVIEKNNNDKMDTILTEMTLKNKMKKQPQQQRRNNDNDKLTGQDELRNVFLKMWDGKVRESKETKREGERNEKYEFDVVAVLVLVFSLVSFCVETNLVIF